MNPSDFGSAGSVAESVEELLVFPDVATATLRLLEDETSSSESIGMLVKQDLSLTAALLRICNSAQYYQGGSAVEDVERALSRVGLRQLKELIYGICIPRATSGMENEVMELSDFWAHSLYTAALSYALASHIPRVSAQTAFTAGLLHDIGQLALFYRFPVECKEIARECLRQEIEMSEAELSKFGFNHQDVGLALAERWLIPETLQKCIGLHHQVEEDGSSDVLVNVVHVANHLSEALETEEDASPLLLEINKDVLDTVIQEDTEISTVIEEALTNYSEMRSMIIPKNCELKGVA